MKNCAICSSSIELEKEPAVLFVGRGGHRYEICRECESLMDKFVASEDEGEKKEAADSIYNHVFSRNRPTELLTFFKELFTADSATREEAEENLKEYREEEAKAIEEAERLADDAVGKAEDAALAAMDGAEALSEEEFLADEKKKTSLATKLVFLFLFLALGGGAIAFGILQDHIFSTVIGAVIALLGVTTIFNKD